MSDNISELLGDQPMLDESTLPDSGTDDSALGSTGIPDDLLPADGPGEPPASRKHVPLAALQEERTRRQELQDELRQQRELSAKMQERFNQLMERMAPPAHPEQPAVEIPPFIEDPEGHIAAKEELVRREMEQMRQFQQQTLQQQQAAQQGQVLAQRVAAAEEEFKTTTPDYPQAVEYFIARKQAEYAAFGADPVTVHQQLQRDFQGIALAATQRGQNPAAVMYAMSKALGFTVPPQAPGTPPAKAAPTSLSNVQGAPRAPDEQGGASLEAIANMTDAEFDKYWSQLERGSKQRPKF